MNKLATVPKPLKKRLFFNRKADDLETFYVVLDNSNQLCFTKAMTLTDLGQNYGKAKFAMVCVYFGQKELKHLIVQ